MGIHVPGVLTHLEEMRQSKAGRTISENVFPDRSRSRANTDPRGVIPPFTESVGRRTRCPGFVRG